MHFTLVFKL